MTRRFPMAILLTAALAAIACTESPTSPSSLDPTAPIAAPVTVPTPAPVSQTLTGTWTGGGQSFTVTQIGNAATGMIAPTTISLGDGVMLTESTMISGSVSGVDVTLQMNDRLVINGGGMAMSCTAGHTFSGTLSGNTLSGTMTAGTTALNCGGDLPAFPVPHISGPIVYTRQ